MMSDKLISMVTSSFCHYCFMCNIFSEIWLFFVLIKLLGTNDMIISPALMYFINSCSWSSLKQQSLLITRTRVHLCVLVGQFTQYTWQHSHRPKQTNLCGMTHQSHNTVSAMITVQHEIMSTCPCLLCDKKQQKFSDRLAVCSGCTPPLTRWLNPFSHNPKQKKSTC